MRTIHIYTDGSCHTQLKVGAWAVIVFVGDERIELTGTATNTTHNAMELTEVIKAVEYIVAACNTDGGIVIYTDSQYVEGLNNRREKFEANAYRTNAGKAIQNAALVKQLLAYNNTYNIRYVKVAAHQKAANAANHHIDADMLCRRVMRGAIAN